MQLRYEFVTSPLIFGTKGLALFAYFLWNIDVHFCTTLTGWKRQLGMPWGILLEFHGWWHVLTAVAAYILMALIEFLTCPEHDESHGIGFALPAKAVLQEIVPKKIMNGNGVAFFVVSCGATSLLNAKILAGWNPDNDASSYSAFKVKYTSEAAELSLTI